MMRSPGEWHERFLQQSSWTKPLREYAANKLAFQNASRILDIGCGTGAVTAQIHDAVVNLQNSSLICGLDLKFNYLRFAKQSFQDLPLSCGNAYELPFAKQTFEIALCHYLFLWLNNPLQGLQEMRRVTRSKGFVIAMAEPDYGGRIDYPEKLMELGKLQTQSLVHQGADPFVGRKLKSLFIQAGLNNVQTGLLGGEWKDNPTEEQINMEWNTLVNDLKDQISTEELEEYRQIETDAHQKGERILFVPTFYCWGQVP